MALILLTVISLCDCGDIYSGYDKSKVKQLYTFYALNFVPKAYAYGNMLIKVL